MKRIHVTMPIDVTTYIPVRITAPAASTQATEPVLTMTTETFIQNYMPMVSWFDRAIDRELNFREYEE